MQRISRRPLQKRSSGQMEQNKTADLLHASEALFANLMCFRPENGAIALAIYFDKHPVYKMGWNLSRSGNYVKITPQGGYTTRVKPGVPDSEIFTAGEELDFETSTAKKKLNNLETCASELIKKGAVDDSDLEQLKRIIRIKSSILRFAGKNETETDDIIKSRYIEMHDALVFESVSGTRNYGVAVHVMNQTVKDYLGYELTGEIAVPVLAYFVVDFCMTISKDHIKESLRHKVGMVLLKNCVQYLQELHEKILKVDRINYDLLSYYRLTYLAVLYGKVATTVIEILQRYVPAEKGAESWSIKKYKAIDEVNVHLGYSTFVYPAVFKSYSADSLTAALALSQRCNIEYVYPQIEKKKIPPRDFKSVFEAIEKETANKPGYDIMSPGTLNLNPLINPGIMNDLALLNSYYS